MTPEQEMVRNFHEMVGATVNEWPTAPSIEDRWLRLNLIGEELDEFAEASEVAGGGCEVDLARVADALGDLLYVVYGAGVTYGIDLAPVFAEIHRSNMLKGQECATCSGIGMVEVVEGVLEDCEDCCGTGRTVTKREDGKVLKGRDWQPPRLVEIIEEQARIR